MPCALIATCPVGADMRQGGEELLWRHDDQHAVTKQRGPVLAEDYLLALEEE